MRKRKVALLIALIVVLLITVPVLAAFRGKKKTDNDGGEMQFISVWQIDGFEGGKGSRKQYLQKLAEKCFKDENVYLNVTALTSDVARENIQNGVIPDAISYPAGFYGIENLINQSAGVYRSWCHGSYCIISLDEKADFGDINCENTVINAGKDNLSGAAAVLCGLGNAKLEEPVNAYLKLINGSYKYLLGTQRDVFRFKTRELACKIIPVTQFNDLYQNISVLTKDKNKVKSCVKFTDYLIAQTNYDSLGLLKEGVATEISELKCLESVTYEYKLNYPCGEVYIGEIKTAIKNNDANKIKNILK